MNVVSLMFYLYVTVHDLGVFPWLIIGVMPMIRHAEFSLANSLCQFFDLHFLREKVIDDAENII